jgi:hypothetical protein
VVNFFITNHDNLFGLAYPENLSSIVLSWTLADLGGDGGPPIFAWFIDQPKLIPKSSLQPNPNIVSQTCNFDSYPVSCAISAYLIIFPYFLWLHWICPKSSTTLSAPSLKYTSKDLISPLQKGQNILHTSNPFKKGFPLSQYCIFSWQVFYVFLMSLTVL